DFSILDFRHDGAERLEVVDERLVHQYVPIGKKQDTLDNSGLPEAPDDLKCGVGLASPRRHHEKHPPLAIRYSFDSSVDCIYLVVARFLARGIVVVRLNHQTFSFVLDAAESLVPLPEF